MSVNYNITAESLKASSYRPLHAGDDYDHKFTVTRGGTALDLTGSKIWFTVKENSVEPDDQAKLQLTSDTTNEIEITDAPLGEFTVKFRGATTENLEGEWLYDMQVKLSAPASTIITLVHGRIEFLPNITRSYT